MFDVKWDMTPGGAFDQLQRIITAHPDRLPEFRSAMRDLSMFLARHPDRRGTDDGRGIRVYHVYPLTVRFRIILNDERVEIVRVELWTA